VFWDGKERALKAERKKGKTFHAWTFDIKSEKSVNPTGSVKCYYFNTDIKTYLDGEFVESYAIGGVTLIDFELLEKYGTLIWNGQTREIRLMLDK
jgi:hypothetical protein